MAVSKRTFLLLDTMFKSKELSIPMFFITIIISSKILLVLICYLFPKHYQDSSVLCDDICGDIHRFHQ